MPEGALPKWVCPDDPAPSIKESVGIIIRDMQGRKRVEHHAAFRRAANAARKLDRRPVSLSIRLRRCAAAKQ